MNMFGILKEGNSEQHTMIPAVDANHDSNAVVSQLHYYLTNIVPEIGVFKEFVFRMCVGNALKLFLF